ncbi:uncharacterized protein LOC109835587 [Asparagus officinalis]|uniref:uncharacterized protein LOC109835587 n=1 Tax=Asparagus officinalis TaxID=4686 RepID=UPI00098E1B93|nr:uncharacterized protein LOC109835587 [Asparagus officinalis]
MGTNFSADSENFEEENFAQNRRRSANINNEENDDSAESNNHRVQSDDVILNESRQEADNSHKKKNPPRGNNKYLKLNNLSHGEKKIITFYQNKAIEPEFSRYLGIIIRDRNICPVAVENWAKIPLQNKDHMWASIKDKFDAEDMEQKRELVMRHLRDLWNKWRGDMHRKYVKENSLQVALRNKPTEVSVDDWDWLVKEHYFSSKFQKLSQQNTLNRRKRKMLHHTGSKPFRQIAWESGGKSGNLPDVAKMFHETRKKANETLENGNQDKYISRICV